MEQEEKNPARQVRIFVSSTFRDMIDDRNELTDQAWPELRTLCQSLQVDFVAVDMRWGINEEQSRRNEVLALVLDEVHNCRPYFIGLVGERYGSVLGDPAYTPDLLHKEPWIQDYRDRSVTELEILHAVLNSPSGASRSYFYFRDPEYARQRGGDFLSDTPDDSKKQSNLKDKIERECKEHGISLHNGYKDPRELASLVLADLMAAIKSDFPIDDSIDPALVEQEAFADTRRQVYVEDETNYELLDRYVQSTGGPLVVGGEAGIGKTALLANWVARWQAAHQNDFLFAQYTASSPQNSSHWSLMRRLVRDIKRWSGDDAPIPDSNEGLLSEFELWLRKLRSAADRRNARAIIVLDGLDQLDEQDFAKLLGWLPETPWGGSLRLIASCRTSPDEELAPSRVINVRGWEPLRVDSLGPRERGDLIVKYLGRFRKNLLPKQVELLADIEAGANPLFLRILLDELLVTGQYGQGMESVLAVYAEAKSISELLDKVLLRWQAAYERDRPHLVSDAMALIWSARRGLTEDEILRCMRADGQPTLPFAIWSPLRYAMWESLTNHGGILNFGHDYLRKAVEHRFLNDGSLASQFRSRLADEFDLDPATARSCEEFPWILSCLGQNDRLQKFLLKRGPFLLLNRSRGADLFSYWQQLDEPNRVGLSYESAFTDWSRIAPTRDQREKGLDAFDLAKFLDSLGAPASAERLVRVSLEAVERFSGPDAPDLAQVNRTLARLLKQDRRYPEAATCLYRALAINEKWYREDDPVIAENLIAIAQLLDAMQQYDQALEFAHRAARIYERVRDLRHLAGAFVSRASILMNAGRFDQATEALEQAQAVGHLREFGPSEALAMSLSYQGDIAAAKKDYSSAVRSFEESVEMFRLLYGDANFSVLRQMNNLATTFLEQGKLSEGLTWLTKSVSLQEKITDESNADFGVACSNLSCALSAAEEYVEALKYSERAVKILSRFDRQPRGSIEYGAALNHYALALLRNGRRDEAIESWAKAVRQMLLAVRVGNPAPEELQTLMANAVYGLQSCHLSGKETYEVLAPQFEAQQMLDLQVSLARQMGGQIDPKEIPVRFLTPFSVDLLPLNLLTEQQVSRKELAKQIDFHIGRVEAAPHVPLPLCRQIRTIVEPCLDAIAYKAIQMGEWTYSDEHFRYSEPGNAILFLASVFNREEDDVREFFVRHSNEEGFGYVSYILRWLNNWPSPDLKMIFHLIICRRDTRKMYHTCFWDNSNGANGPKDFVILPVELLTNTERKHIS